MMIIKKLWKNGASGCVTGKNMKKLNLKIIKIFFISAFITSLYGNNDFSVLKNVFDAPFGYDPVLQTSKLNGVNELKVVFKTEVPYNLLKQYYSSLLESKGWKETSLNPIINDSTQFFDNFFNSLPDKLFFLKDGMILLISYLKTENENYFSISFLDSIPSLSLNIDDIDFSYIDGIIMPGINPLLDYSLDSGIGMNSKLNFFETDASVSYVMDFYKYTLINYGWHENKIIKEFKNEIKQIIGVYGHNILNFDNICILQKDNGTILFIFVMEVPGQLKTTFGYFVKNFSNDKNQEG